MNEKIIFGMFVIGIVSCLQGVAWHLGINGQIFHFTSLVIGLISGSILGFSFSKNKRPDKNDIEPPQGKKP